jgi:hypothetical protein
MDLLLFDNQIILYKNQVMNIRLDDSFTPDKIVQHF